ncbi:hypothetical protein GOP47_0019112 [Adiantum capillus-veneris]|uniref:Uncharacterized protein n=1 Tax=Adiantum capillus-veneris TaxID=13818 RepID=A0A9D4Z8S6_ADICA|nr:hypothetical protein GOP47_0019112 [Adiantum capillus-veneris]
MALQRRPGSSSSAAGQEAFLLRRPGHGKLGEPTAVYANHFRVRFEGKTIFHYDVTIEPDPPKGLHRAVLNQAVREHQSQLQGKVAYDGQRALYTARELPEVLEMEIELSQDEGPKRRNNRFKITLREASRIRMGLLQEYLDGNRRVLPQDCLQALDIVLREAASGPFIQKGRCFFGSHFGERSLGGGVQAYSGFYQSIRPAQNGLLSLNIDIAAAPFLEAIDLPDFLAKAFRKDIRDLNQELAKPDAYGDQARVKAKKLLKGIRVETVHNRGAKRKYRIQSLSNEPLRNLRFDMDGESISVIDYFFRTYNYKIMLPGLPAIESGTKEKKRYLPMEVCKIVAGQPFIKSMGEPQKKALLGITCVPPEERKETTRKIQSQLRIESKGLANEFGVGINSLITEIPARILPPPAIQYRTATIKPPPGLGSWNMRNKQMVTGCKIERWSLINFSHTLQERAVDEFCRKIPRECDIYGLTMNPTMVARPINETRGNVEGAIKHQNRQCVERSGQDLDLLICIMPQTDNKSVYAAVKRVCEIELGVVTQCCLSDHVRNGRPDYIANLLLKVNAKMGGYNALLVDERDKKLPLISEVPSIIIGADVSHPRVGDDNSPSISAVAASMDWPYFSKYEAIVQTQRQREEVCQELFWEREDGQGIVRTGGILKDLLRAFSETQGRKPERIMYYRDGVSEGEFEAVLNSELEAIKKACEALGWGKREHAGGNGESQSKRQQVGDELPKITFIVVQKRHHTRLFPKQHQTKNGNIFPGTVVDDVICHPTHFDFYLCSHYGIKGTSRPAHYHVLRDDNEFTVDQIQQLTNDLCFMYVRCTRAVSIVPPCYYAHLAATRARLWLGPEGSDEGSLRDRDSQAGGSAGGSSRGTHSRAGGAAVGLNRPLPPLHERIRKSMFYI